jgi:hypothetical protein
MTALTAVIAAVDFVSKALGMLEKTGWTRAHRFLFSDLRMHLLGWGPSLAPHGRRITVNGATRGVGSVPTEHLHRFGKPIGLGFDSRRYSPDGDDPQSEKVALFRYGLIATLVLERLSRGEPMRRARELGRASL